jgi:hypothetical protein
MATGDVTKVTLTAGGRTIEWEAGRLRIPADAEFEDDEEFKADRALAALAVELIERHPGKFGFLRNVEVKFLWKRNGGRSQGKARLGYCAKTSGLARHYAGADFVIWLAADTARDCGLGPRELEALLFHEMSHIDYDDEADKPTVRCHDFEGFIDELAEYGEWLPDLRRARHAFAQLPLAAAAD